MLNWEMFYHYLATMLTGTTGAAVLVWAPISTEKGGPLALMFR